MSESEKQIMVQECSSTPSLQNVPRKPEKNNSANEALFTRVAKSVVLPAHMRKSWSLSPMYSPSTKAAYMEQCFDDVKYLAEGSFGVVFEARSKDDGKLYAVKQFKKRFGSKQQRSVKLGEVHRYASLPQSRFCVQLISAWEEDAYLYVQMELCSVTLKQHISRHGLTEELLWKILLDLLLAVRHLHSNQLVHLDIKPDNILVSPDQIFKLADFGLMLDLSMGPVQDAEDGDARYLAPEVLRGTFTQAADIFSLGITMFEVGTNLQLPSHGCLWQELRCGVLPFCRFSCESKELFELIERMMVPIPKDRPSAKKLLKYNRLAKMHRNRLVQSFLNDVASSVKSICAYGKVIAVHCGLRVIKPFMSRICLRAWKRKAKSSSEIVIPCQHRQDPPPLQRPTGNTNTSVQRTEEEEKLFRARLAACKKRLTFDDEGHTDTTAIDEPSSSNGNAGSIDGAMKQQFSPKRRTIWSDEDRPVQHSPQSAQVKGIKNKK